MAISTIAKDIHLMYLQSQLKVEQVKYKELNGAHKYPEAYVSADIIEEYQCQISLLQNQDNIFKLLKEVLNALESGEINVMNGKATYTQQFGEKFVERIKSALN